MSVDPYKGSKTIQMKWSNAMAFSDPQSVTIGGTTTSLPRTSSSPFGEFLSADGAISMQVKHTRGNRVVSTASIKVNKVAADPYVSGVNRPVNAVVNISINHPVQGFSATELLDIYKGLAANLAATTDANAKKLLGLES